jgi:hypothetical protein
MMKPRNASSDTSRGTASTGFALAAPLLPAAASVGFFLPSLVAAPDDALDDGLVAPVGAAGEPNDPIGFDDGCGPRSRDCGGKSSRAMRWAFQMRVSAVPCDTYVCRPPNSVSCDLCEPESLQPALSLREAEIGVATEIRARTGPFDNARAAPL